jgi:hypothetical protein
VVERVVKPDSLIRGIGLIALLLVLAAAPAWAEESLILPHPALLRGQLLLRQAEQDGAAALTPMAVLTVQEKINAAWSAYHLQVEERADDPDDEEAILARQLAEEVELDAELLRVTLRTQDSEARLDSVRASLNLPAATRLVIPPPGLPTTPVKP